MKIVVTGGGGFIGAAVIAHAEAQGHRVWRFDRQDGNDIMGDLTDLDGADRVIHLAGMLGTHELFDTPQEAVEVNVNGTLRILQWCRETGAGYTGITMPDSSWANVYQATKLCAMRLATAWHKNFGIPVSHVRAFNAYGPGQKYGPGHPQKIIPTFAKAAWEGVSIPIWGSGNQTVDLIHADDVAKILVAACWLNDDAIVDAGTGIPVTVNKVAEAVNRYAGNTATPLHLPMRRGEELETNIVAYGEGWNLIGWKPELDWNRVKETVDWYRDH